MITEQEKVRNTKIKLQLQNNCKSNMQRESKNRTSATGKRIRVEATYSVVLDRQTWYDRTGVKATSTGAEACAVKPLLFKFL